MATLLLLGGGWLLLEERSRQDEPEVILSGAAPVEPAMIPEQTPSRLGRAGNSEKVDDGFSARAQNTDSFSYLTAGANSRDSGELDGQGGGRSMVAPVVLMNRAGVEQFQTLPGIGPVLAQRIVAFREEHGPFKTVEDLLLVKGIGEKRFTEIKPLVRVSGSEE